MYPTQQIYNTLSYIFHLIVAHFFMKITESNRSSFGIIEYQIVLLMLSSSLDIFSKVQIIWHLVFRLKHIAN